MTSLILDNNPVMFRIMEANQMVSNGLIDEFATTAVDTIVDALHLVGSGDADHRLVGEVFDHFGNTMVNHGLKFYDLSDPEQAEEYMSHRDDEEQP